VKQIRSRDYEGRNTAGEDETFQSELDGISGGERTTGVAPGRADQFQLGDSIISPSSHFSIVRDIISEAVQLGHFTHGYPDDQQQHCKTETTTGKLHVVAPLLRSLTAGAAILPLPGTSVNPFSPD
jgi:hypothetical protein